MKRFPLFFLIIFSNICFPQTVTKLFEQNDFDELVKYGDKIAQLTPEEIYYVGYAFFRNENDEKAISLYNIAIDRGFDNAIVYFQKGLSEMYLKQNDKALKDFDLAILKNPQAEFFIEKGRIYKFQGNQELEIKTYLEGLEKSPKQSHYVELLKITGNYYYAGTKEFAKASELYKKGIIDFPKEYQLYEKLIKSLNAQNKFDEANIYFEKMRGFYVQKILEEDYMKFKNVAVDEFSWNNQWINVYKSFEIPKEILESLYKVYLIDKSGEKVERKFNIEKTYQLKKNEPKYVICEETQNGHATFARGWKDENINLHDLRNNIISILNKTEKPAGSINFKK